ncbi:MAG: bacteriochlorophyll/chlorophyll a synthase [Rhodobacteraceae bacterium]|nr:MAG: bacteriochlorophyll/chlorophyll a synthase [Paracoccaceae bacterium]
MIVNQSVHIRKLANLSVSVELLKPITWFPPMWAFLCGAVSAGFIFLEHLPIVLLGILLAGPVICGMSQAINDWGDRVVDAINEPSRPIPSGRISSTWAFSLAIILSFGGLLIGWSLGEWVLIATIVAIFCAWVYSVEPIRLKKSGILGPSIVAICYEGLPWFTGAAVISQGLPDIKILLFAALYAFGAFGIMTLNDFKALKGDTITGVNSLPVTMGPEKASKVACAVMTIPQLIVISLLYFFGEFIEAILIGLLVISQIILMRKLIKNPEKMAPWYNATGVTLYVIGMMIAAIALRGLI